MAEWKQTFCILCYVNCGLEVATEGGKITRVRGDRANARSQGYLCQKPQRLQWYGDHADRLTTPLRRRPDGTHEAISWETAFTEIAARLNAIRAEHGGEAFAVYGGGGQGNHLGGTGFLALRDVLGATKYFNALSQEKTGDFWVNGRLYGDQLCHTAEDVAPAWRKSDPDGALRIHPDDIAALGAIDGGWMAVSTRTGRLVCGVESDPSMRRGLVALPHGYGQSYPDGTGGRIVDGPRLNLITAHDDCDPIAATPYHKNIAVHLAPVVDAEANPAEAAARVRAVAAAHVSAA